MAIVDFSVSSGEAGQVKSHVRRLGKFVISTDLIEKDLAAVRVALDGCVVVRAEAIWHMNHIGYVALHDDFDVVEAGCEAPAYECLLHKGPGGSVSRTWKKITDGGFRYG